MVGSGFFKATTENKKGREHRSVQAEIKTRVIQYLFDPRRNVMGPAGSAMAASAIEIAALPKLRFRQFRTGREDARDPYFPAFL